MEQSGWVSVRCVFRSLHGEDQVYEERVTLWQAPDAETAITLAEQEALEYAATVNGPPGWPTEYLGLAQAYLLVDSPSHGAEVFSLMRSSTLDSQTYLDVYFDSGTERQRLVNGQ